MVLSSQVGKRKSNLMNNNLNILFFKLMHGQKKLYYSVMVPYCKANLGVLRVLVQQGYIFGFRIVQKTKQLNQIKIILSRQITKISQIRRISKSSCRKYYQKKKLTKSKDKSNCVLISTPLGILSGQEALSLNVGGEILFEIF